MFRDKRSEIAEMAMEVVDSARTPREMRDAEALLEGLVAEHGRYDLLVGAIEEISRRILYTECGKGEEEMLTHQEEDALRRIARENSPMQVVNPGQARPSDESFHAEGSHLERLIQ